MSDIVCIYCPETDACYYVRPAEHGDSVTLRIEPSRSNQLLGVLQASLYTDITAARPNN